MNKILFLLTITLFYVIIFLNPTNNNKEYIGQIEKIKIYENIIYLKLNESPINFVIFTDKILNLEKNNFIKIKGQEQIYNNQKQVVVNKIRIIQEIK